MKTRLAKIAAAVMVLFFTGAGAALADKGHGRGYYGPPTHSHGYYKHKGPPAYVHAPRFGYHKHHHHYHHRYPVIVQKHYYHPPAYYVAPAPSGYFFGFSAVEPGFGFSFGASGR